MVQGKPRQTHRLAMPVMITLFMALAAGCGSSAPSHQRQAPQAPAGWTDAALRDVQTGETFHLADFRDRVVLLETMATWCRNCLRQQGELNAYLSQAGDRVLAVRLDVDTNEDAATLRAYARKYAFDGRHAIASRELATQLSDQFGEQVLNPSATPIIVIDKAGEAHLLPFGIKSVEDLQRLVRPFL